MHTYPEWVKACTSMMRGIQSGRVSVNCPVDVLVSDTSVHWAYTRDAGNTLGVTLIVKYSKKLEVMFVFT
jgi:hypothetical protein